MLLMWIKPNKYLLCKPLADPQTFPSINIDDYELN